MKNTIPLIDKIDEHGKHIVWQEGDYSIAVNNITVPTYVTLWYKSDRMGSFYVDLINKKGVKWYKVSSVHINHHHKGNGLGKKMYQVLLSIKNDVAGIYSYLPDRSNKKQIPAIYNSLGGYVEDEDYAYIPKLNEMKIIPFKLFLESDLDQELKAFGLKRTNKFGKIGKEIGGEIYLHADYENTLPQEDIKFAKQLYYSQVGNGAYQVVKYNPKTHTVTFIYSDDFDNNDEPSVRGGVTIKPDGTIKKFYDAGWIYHHKWMWVADDYNRFDVDESKRRSLAWYKLTGVDKARIGQRKFWDSNVVPQIQESITGENMKGYRFDGKMLSYKEYLLSEGISPSVTKYGTDFENGEWKELSNLGWVTFFEYSNEFYAVVYVNGFIGFVVNYTDNKDTVLDYINRANTFEQLWMNFHFNRTPTHIATTIFSRTFYVMLSAIEHFKPELIRFDGYRRRLSEFYEVLIQNKNFTSQVEHHGYKYIGKTEQNNREFCTFQRI